MQLNRAPQLGSGLLTDIGHIGGQIMRTGVGLFKSIRGDTGDTVVAGAAPINYANMAVYGTLAVVAAVILLKPARR